MLVGSYFPQSRLALPLRLGSVFSATDLKSAVRILAWSGLSAERRQNPRMILLAWRVDRAILDHPGALGQDR